jgi:surface polysaccharide O-acyltransferase-like enzyme
MDSDLQNEITAGAVAMPPIRKKERMEWLDALRGFTMILVVAYHVATTGFAENIKLSSSLPLLVLFRMPLFFFISGFLAYKSDFVWTRGRLGMMMWKKLKIQVFPALIFFCISLVVLHPKFGDAFMKGIASPTKCGYWFTWSLLHMFVLYYLFSFFESKWNKRRSWVPIAILWFVALSVYATIYMPSWFDYHKDPFFHYSSLVETMRYFHFFVFGNIVRRYWNSWQRLFDTNWFFPLMVVVCFFCCADILKWHTLQFQWTNLPRTTAMYLLLLMVFMFFRYYKDSFTKNTRVGRFLQYIGVRTLDIYLIHFLFLPRMFHVGESLNELKHNFVFDICVSVAYAMLVLGFTCLVSNMLRMSPWFRRYLFGRK